MTNTSYTIAVNDVPDATGLYTAELLGTALSAKSPCRDRAAMAVLLAALAATPVNEAAGVPAPPPV